MSARAQQSADFARRERRAMYLWTSIIVGLLLTGIASSVGGALAALHGKPVVEDDYYNKALHWDDHAALAQASIALGWKAELTVGTDVTTGGERALMLKVTSRAGVPLEDARVAIAFFHRARPLELHQLDLKSVGAGMYAASAPINRAGMWEFRLTVRHAKGTSEGAMSSDDMYVQSLTRDLLE